MNPFLVALGELAEHGWCQNLYVDADGAICAIEALDRSTKDLDELERVRRLAKATIAEQYPDLRGLLWTGEGLGIADWNDRPDRTETEVRSLLEKCAARWDES